MRFVDNDWIDPSLILIFINLFFV